MFWNPSRVPVSVSQVYCKISVLSILVTVHVMSKSIVYILVIAGIQPRYAYPVHFWWPAQHFGNNNKNVLPHRWPNSFDCWNLPLLLNKIWIIISENYWCLCGALPCICDACHPLSPKDDHHVPKIMLRKSASGWASTSTSDHPVSSSPTLSNAPVCQNCSHAFLDPSHQCDTDKDDTLSQSNDTSGGEVFQDSDTLDLQACKDLVFSDLHTADEKHSILKKKTAQLCWN